MPDSKRMIEITNLESENLEMRILNILMKMDIQKDIKMPTMTRGILETHSIINGMGITGIMILGILAVTTITTVIGTDLIGDSTEVGT